MDNNKNNTFGDYIFPKWVPNEEQELIKDFWGCFGRTYKDWLDAQKCHSNSDLPKTGERCRFNTENYIHSKQDEVEGLFLYMWGNIGRVIDDKGVSHFVSSILKWESLEENKSQVKS